MIFNPPGVDHADVDNVGRATRRQRLQLMMET
jgi:hypothetical protein